MRLEHLLAMTAGLAWKEWGAAYEPGTGNDLVTMIQTAPDWTQYVLDRPMDQDPGTTFLYNSGASYLLSSIVSRLAGRPASDLAAERLFTPLGIDLFDWPAGPEGVTTGWGNLRLRPQDLAKLGLLYLQRGEWDGQQLLPAQWVEASTTDQVADPAYEYGYQWWLDAADGYAFMAGRFGQIVIVAPKQDMVIVIMANLPDTVSAAVSVPRWLAEEFILSAAQ
jgi:CubicO group peptidase (beta-lactamase class C family)